MDTSKKGELWPVLSPSEPCPLCPTCQKVLINLGGLNVSFENESDVGSSKLRGISLLIECDCGSQWDIRGKVTGTSSSSGQALVQHVSAIPPFGGNRKARRARR